MLSLPHRCHILIRHHRMILMGALLATVVGTYFTLQLPLRADLDSLLPDDYPSVHAMNRMRAEVGGSGRFRIVLEGQRFDALVRYAQELEPRLAASPFVKYVDYINDDAFYRRNALLFLNLTDLDSLQAAIQQTIDNRKQALNPLMVDDLFGDDTAADDGEQLGTWEERYQSKEPKRYNTNADSTVLVLEVFPLENRSDLGSTRRMLENLRAIVDSVDRAPSDEAIQVYFGGSLKNRLDEYEVIKSDILGTALYGIGGVVLLIALFFGNVAGVVLVTVSLAFSITWTFGLTYLVIGELNTLTGFLFVILFGLGIDYGIHTFARYTESRRNGLGVEESLDRMVCQTGSAVGTTAVTTAVAFLLLLFMDFKGFAHLGFIAGTGVLLAFFAMVMVLPALIIIAERIGFLRIPPLATAATPDDTRRHRPIPFARSIVGGAVGLTLLAAYLSTKLSFEYDFTNLRAISEERKLVGEKTTGVFTLSESPAVVLADTREEVGDIVTAVQRKIAEDTLSPTIASVRSIFSLVPDDQSTRLEKIRTIRTLVETEAKGVVTGKDKERLDKLETYLQVDRPFTWDDFPAADKRQFLNRSGEIGNFVFVYPSVQLRDGKQAIAFRDDVGTITTASGKAFHAASSNIISADMLVLMLSEGRWAVLLAVLTVFFLIWLDFRSLGASLLVIAPLVIGFVWIGGAMYILGFKLNFYNIVVFPSIIGIGVDNGVHLYHRYLEEGKGSLRRVLRRTGVAIAMTTLTTIVGYSGLILARHPGLNSIGDLAVIGITTTFVTALVFLPALLQVLEGRKPPASGA